MNVGSSTINGTCSNDLRLGGYQNPVTTSGNAWVNNDGECKMDNYCKESNTIRRKIYKTAREEFFKDLVQPPQNSDNMTCNLHPSYPKNASIDQKVRVGGHTIVSAQNKSMGDQTNAAFPHSSLCVQQNLKPFSNVLNNSNDSTSTLDKYFAANSTYDFDAANHINKTMGYNSLKRRKKEKTANLSNLLR